MNETLSQLLNLGCISLDIKARKKREVIEELVGLLAAAGHVREARAVVDEVMERENMVSTGIGNGIAIPHRLTTRVDRMVLAFGRKMEGISFDAIDKKPVVFCFLILGPQGRHAEHLRLLSRLSRFLHDDEFLAALKNASTAADIIDAFRRQESD